MFDPGQKVVCVDDKFTPAALRWLKQTPVEGKVYVVRDVKIGFSLVKRGKREGGVRVLLIGLVNPNAEDGQEHGFSADRFRSLEEIKSKVEKALPGTVTVTWADGTKQTFPAELIPNE